MLLSIYMTLNAAKSFISFGRVKRQPQTWRPPEVEEAVRERHKAFAAAHKSDEDRQVYISASQHAFSVISKAEAWQATCSFLLNQSILSFVLLLVLLPTFVTSPTVFLYRSTPIK